MNHLSIVKNRTKEGRSCAGRLLPQLLLFVLPVFIFLSCEKDFEGISVPLAVNSTSLELDSIGPTHVLVYSTGKWQVRFAETTSWASLNKTEGSGNSDFVLNYDACVDTARSAVIILSRDTIVREISIHQAALSDFIK